MKAEIIEPTYKNLSALSYLAYTYEYPKHKECFIWGVPNDYTERLDYEISSITACFIYDGLDKSINAAKEVESWFMGQPYNFIIEKRYNNIIMNRGQDERIYGYITIKDLYLFFSQLHALYSEYDGILGKYRVMGNQRQLKTMTEILSSFNGFRGHSVLSYARINLFLFMMVHCFEVYPFDESELIIPVFHRQFSACRRFILTRHKRLTIKTAEDVSHNLKWYTTKYPMTFAVGIYAYIHICKNEPRLAKKVFDIELRKRKFRKR